MQTRSTSSAAADIETGWQFRRSAARPANSATASTPDEEMPPKPFRKCRCSAGFRKGADRSAIHLLHPSFCVALSHRHPLGSGFLDSLEVPLRQLDLRRASVYLPGTGGAWYRRSKQRPRPARAARPTRAARECTPVPPRSPQPFPPRPGSFGSFRPETAGSGAGNRPRADLPCFGSGRSGSRDPAGYKRQSRSPAHDRWGGSHFPDRGSRASTRSAVR